MSDWRIGQSLLRTFWLICSLAGLWASAANAQDEPVSLSILTSDSKVAGVISAYQSLLLEHPELQGRVDLSFLTTAIVNDLSLEDVSSTDVLILDMHDAATMDIFNDRNSADLIGLVSANGPVYAVGSGLQPIEDFTAQGAIADEQAMAYWQHGGPVNNVSVLKLVLSAAGIEGLTPAAVAPSIDFGFYYPDDATGQVYADWDDFNARLDEAGVEQEGKPRVAIGFYQSSFYSSDMAIVDALIAEVERQGAVAIPFFGYPGQIAFERLLLDEQGESRVDVALSFLLRFANFEATASLEKLNVPVINVITLYGRSEQEWRESETGLSMFEGTFAIAVPELAGLVAPTVVGSREKLYDSVTNTTVVVGSPIQPRMEMAVSRALSFVELADTPPAERRLALMYYNYPVGEANIGASYLNVAESLATILRSLREAGYDLGGQEISPESVLEDITTRARNIGVYAPGELEELIAAGGVEELPLATYQSWLDELAPELKDKILQDWGDPADAELMISSTQEGKNIVIPRLRYGNVILMPQPARGWSADLEMLYHAEDLAPHHQYVAAYTWLRETEGVHAIVHMGTHGTLEWLDGKDAGLTAADAPDAMIGDVPNINIYNVDVVGEGLIARRRGMATLVDHMVPPFVAAGSYSDLAEIGESINDYHRNLHKNEELSRAYADQIIEQLTSSGLAKTLSLDLKLDENGQIEHEILHAVQSQISLMRAEYIPYGMHRFGELPAEEAVESTVKAIFETDRSRLSDPEFYYSQEIRDSITQSPQREIGSLLNALSGGFTGTGTGGEPIRNPDAYPTGKNFYGIDPNKVPKKAAWKLGVELADQMLAQHLEENGRYPEKVSFVIWGTETMRHEGVLESQIFHLLGTRPVWDARDKVIDVEIVPSRELGRPRIDIVIASAAEGMFNNVTMLMDKAVQQVKALEETENFVREHYLETRAQLISMGYEEEDADRRASVRIFDEPPGTFNLNTNRIAAASGSWDSTVGMANEYINKMGHGYGNGFWGEPMQDVFKLALEDVETVVHSSSTALYGALDNDDFFMYMGGLSNAVELLSGDTPELLVANTRNPSNPEMASIDKFIGTEFATRYINPNWIEGMQAEGYAGARVMSEFVEYLWGWDATVTDVVDNTMWQQTFEVYVQDKHELGMDEFFDESSPYAFQDMSARMIETVRKGYWEADQATLTELLESYVESVKQHGLSCSDVTCANPRLMEYIVNEGEAAGLDGVDLAELRAAIEAATGADLEQLARELEQFAELNDAQISQLYQQAQEAPLQGVRMEPIEQPEAFAMPEGSAGPNWLTWLIQLAVLLSLLAWWARRRSAPSH